MKLWDKNNSGNEKIIEFTIGHDRLNDMHLIKYDLKASISHAKMLYKSNLLSEIECDRIINILNEMLIEAESGELKIEKEFEDMHSKIEYTLISRLGDIGKKIHTARSRNDQVLVSIQLYLIDELNNIKTEVKSLFDLLIKLANKNKDIIMPGYTHMKAAMPSSFGLWFSAYAETLIDDIISLNSSIEIVNQNTLGSAAGYGTSFEIDREARTILIKDNGVGMSTQIIQDAFISIGGSDKQNLSAEESKGGKGLAKMGILGAATDFDLTSVHTAEKTDKVDKNNEPIYKRKKL